jgi:iron(III) transport system permease protein
MRTPLAIPRVPRLRRPDGWSVAVLLTAALAASPLVALLGIAAQPNQGLWGHLLGTVLPLYVVTTAELGLAVAVGVGVLGVSTAWLVTVCRFPGRRTFRWALLLPLAMPTYLAAFAYTDLLEYAGPVQGTLRALLGWRSKADYWFPEVRSLGGAAVFMTLVLYPYVYLLARAAFLEQSAGALEAGRSLGRGPWRCFFTVALPLARPAIAVGVLLALMETLNDFGTVEFFAVPTFTVGIYRVWFGMNNAPAAAQLATFVLAVVLGLIWLERAARSRARFDAGPAGKARPLPGFALRGWRAALAVAACALPVLLGFGVPAGMLLRGSLASAGALPLAELAGVLGNSLLVSTLAGGGAVGVGLLLAYGQRQRGGPLVRGAARVASVGYAVPGTVLALGVLIPAAALDNAVDALLRAWLGVSSGLLLSGTVAAVTFACILRFLALSFGTLEASLGKITRAMDHAARSLGATPAGALWRVHLPLMRPSVLTAGLLVFVDTMKELPMTLILRPFNFDTLATHVFELASYERFHQAAPAALAIVLAGLLPVILLSRGIARSRDVRPPRAGAAAADTDAVRPWGAP